MRRLLLVSSLLLSLSLGSPVLAADPPADCLAAPDQACLLVWSKDEMIASFSSGGAQSGASEASIVASGLIGLGRGVDAVELIVALPDASMRYFILDGMWETDHSLGELPAFRQAIEIGLPTESSAFLSDDPNRGTEWPEVIGLADKIGLSDAARSAFAQGVDAMRAGGFTDSQTKDAKLRMGIEAALQLMDLETARELAGLSTSEDLIGWAQMRIAMAEKSGKPWPTPALEQPQRHLDAVLSHEQFEAALREASRAEQFANIALRAAMAQETAVAGDALDRFAQLKPVETMPGQALACNLAAGFAHVLLDDGFDPARLFSDADAQLESMRVLLADRSSFGGLFWWFTAWNISALKMLAGVEPAFPDNIPGGTPFDEAIMHGGAAAVALGIAGERARPHLQDAMRLVAQVPTPSERATVLKTMAEMVGQHTIAGGDICR